MTFTDLLADAYRMLNYSSSPPSDVVTRLKAMINEGHRAVLTMPGMVGLRDGTTTFASVASQVEYGLPQVIARINKISERTYDTVLLPQSVDWYREVEPDPQEGTPEYYIPRGLRAVAKQPSDASEIFVDSTSASDTGTAYLEAVRTGGYPVSLSVTMTGTTAVSLGTAYTDIVEISDFYISAAAVGTVTLHEDASGGTELARIAIGQTRSRYQTIALWPTPSAAVTYYVDYTRAITDLVNGNDEPMLPADFHPMLVTYATLKEWRKKDDARAFQDARAEWNDWVDKLKYHLYPADYIGMTGGVRTRGHSQLGPWYPPGS